MATLDLSGGTLFAGDYRVVEPLAQGGMGAVYVVEQVSTGRRRALKVMHPLLVADAKMQDRFIQEAKVGGLVDSDHVVEVITAGVDEASSIPWLCMELLEGETLQERLERLGALPIDELKEVVRQLRHALARAHAKGLVHRDLKPENIFLERARRSGVPFTVKILDFGIAKLVQQAKGRQASGTQALGSPLWMAPEQANAQPISPATDVWALGLIAFTALTGRVYWRTAATSGDLHLTKLLVEILVDPMSKGSERAIELTARVVPGAGFDVWFERCLRRDPTKRFTEAGACLDALIEVLSNDTMQTLDSSSAAAALAHASTTPATPLEPSALGSVDSHAMTAQLDESVQPIVHAETPRTPPAVETEKKKAAMGMGQIAAILAGSVLVALMALFGGVAGIGLFSASEDAERSIADTDGDPTPRTVSGDPVMVPIVPNPDATPSPNPNQIPDTPAPPPPDDPPNDLGPRPVAASRAGRVFYTTVVQACWTDELATNPHPTPTRMRIELMLGPGGRNVENMRLPVAWQGTTLARCVSGNLRHARFDEVPDRTTIILNLPASR